MIKAVIFDFDGLILDTETAWYESYREILTKNHQFDLKLEDFVKCVGADDTSLFDHLRKNLGDTFVIDDIRNNAKTLHSEKVKKENAREGVEQYLTDARQAGLKIALATSSTRQWVETHLTNLGLIHYFDHLITQNDVNRIKPAPDLFWKAIDVLGIKPEEGLVFEDSLNGLIAAQKAHLTTVIIPNPVTEALPFENYHMKLSSMSEMSLADILHTIS
jgi:putative hydrolase of the HAD superfamily